MSERMRGHYTRLGVVRDHRRRSWVVICPAAEFVLPIVCEGRAEAPAPLAARRPTRRRRTRLHLSGIDTFVLMLIAGLYGSLFYCLVTVIR
jgi:hypothetical protein